MKSESYRKGEIKTENIERANHLALSDTNQVLEDYFTKTSTSQVQKTNAIIQL